MRLITDEFLFEEAGKRLNNGNIEKLMSNFQII